MIFDHSREVWIDEAFTELHKKSGSGYYFFNERLGMGGIFYMTSIGVIPYNPPMVRAVSRYHDAYDILRAVHEGAVYRMDMVRDDVADST